MSDVVKDARVQMAEVIFEGLDISGKSGGVCSGTRSTSDGRTYWMVCGLGPDRLVTDWVQISLAVHRAMQEEWDRQITVLNAELTRHPAKTRKKKHA
jgi:hypothetical protein